MRSTRMSIRFSPASWLQRAFSGPRLLVVLRTVFSAPRPAVAQVVPQNEYALVNNVVVAAGIRRHGFRRRT